MKKEIIITLAVSTAILIPSTVWGFTKTKNYFDKWRTKIAIEAIDQKVLSMKIQISKDGKTVLASGLSKSECQQALYLASLNETEYNSRIQNYETKLSMIKDLLTGE